MTDTEKLYETMGELLYVLAKADGVIQEEEVNKLNELLEGHQWAKDVKWSFDYETAKENQVEDVYQKVLTACHSLGPSPIYEEFISSMNVIANADNKVDENESEIIHSFSHDLIDRFKKDLSTIKR